MFVEIPASNTSISNRKPLHGVGINDADYMVRNHKIKFNYMCPYYRRWADMIKRCYSPKFQAKYITYKDAYVCDSWLTFSNFKLWMISQDWSGKDLDKDIINPGNKIYSPSTCAFVEPWLNKSLVDQCPSRGSLPQGVYWNSQRNKYQVNITINMRVKSLGRFVNLSDAVATYKAEKSRVFLHEASKHSDKRVANGLRLHAKAIMES